MKIINQSTNKSYQVEQAKVLARIGCAKNIPVFCLFAAYEEDCVTQENGRVLIKSSEDKKQTIK